MLTKLSRREARRTVGPVAIVASRYNARYVDALLRHARRELALGGVRGLRVVRVPGAFEIPVVAAQLARSTRPPFAAIVCLGVILQGETSHARHIGDAVTYALVQIQLEHRVPVIHGVYVFENPQQAQVRCLGKEHNRGIEVARTALAMVNVMRELGGD